MDEELLSKFISTVTSAVVAECTQHSFNVNRDNLNTFYEKVADKVKCECDSIVPKDEEPTPIQQLKIDMQEFFSEFQKKLTAEIKDEIRLQVMMELDIELDSVKAAIKSINQGQIVKTTEIKPSIKKTEEKQIMSIKKKDGIIGLPPVTQCNLESNPLFMRVNQNLERIKQGKNYTVEEFIYDRGDRLDIDRQQEIRRNAEIFKQQFDSDDESEEDLAWSKMNDIMRDRDY